MKKIIELALNRIIQGKGSVFVTIVENTGSAPRTAGAAMLVGEEGYLTGTIGGGMLEYRSTQEAQENLKEEKSTLRQYRLKKDEVAGLGMICGGNVDVLFKVILPTENNKIILEKIQHCLNHYENGWFAIALEGEKIGFIGEKGECYGISEDKIPVIHSHQGKRSYLSENAQGEKYYITNLENTSKVYIFGGGHLAQELVPIISHLGFRCVITDDREEFSNKQLFPLAEEIYTRDFDSLYGNYEIHEQDYIIAMTRGHMGDYDVQKFALRTPAYYIGVVGSRHKIAAVNARLREDGFTEDEISRITTPIGIKIHSETPAEIAVSIAAQLIEKRADYLRQK